MSEKIILICTPLRFYSPIDEDLCFQWIKSITCIGKYYGIGRELHLEISLSRIPFNDLRSFMGLFRRYKFKNADQLKGFMNEDNKEMFD